MEKAHLLYNQIFILFGRYFANGLRPKWQLDPL